MEYRSITEVIDQGSHWWIYICTLRYGSCKCYSLDVFIQFRPSVNLGAIYQGSGGGGGSYLSGHIEKSNSSTSSCCSANYACKGKKNAISYIL